MSSIRTRISLLVAFAAVLAAAPARGDKDPSEKEAAARYKQGRAYYDAGVYDKALAEFQAAMAIAPRPLLHYHMGRSYAGLGDRAKAVAEFQEFVTAEPDNKAADDARAQIAKLTAELQAEEEARAREAAEREAAERAAANDAARDEPVPGGALRETGVVDASPPAFVAPPEPPRERKKAGLSWGWIGGGAGALAAGVLLDVIPESGRNGELEPVDFIPAAFYAFGLVALGIGVF